MIYDEERSTSKQKNMLKYQLETTYDVVGRKCLVDRGMIDKLWQMNLEDKVGKFDTMDIISVLQDYNKNYDKRGEKLIGLANTVMRHIIEEIEAKDKAVT